MSRLLVLACLLPLASGCERPYEDPIEPIAATPPPATGAVPVAPPLDTGSPGSAVAPVPTARARVDLRPTQDHHTHGALRVEARNGTLHLSGRVLDLVPGSEHGFHIHEHGDCSAEDAGSAGDHFDPTDQPHGPPTAAHHRGDLANLGADDRGEADVNLVLHGLELGTGGMNDIAGRAVIVHARPDDYRTQPGGDSGARIACGVIERLDVATAARPREDDAAAGPNGG